ncbi:MAG: 4-(cytidine 5'-diphospho)-2-C-methyl-D-erythritol kinase, partial [Lachnospiraceae bacterium]|nr:4-(cytidine 5'-diphospho)-2-C-methyl-D-erythritol kinase [Lachnospiraceae bacterium]
MRDKIQLKALAKINLGLDVLRRREDGYHEVKMLMQTVTLHDELELQRIREPGIRVETNLPYLPTNENNLVYKAAKLLMDEFDIRGGLAIRLTKRIPVAAGMAGGSADGAAVLWGVNQMYGLGLSREALMERGVQLGADVPYCVMRGTALAEGIGERLKPLPSMPHCTILIAKPGVNVSTRFVYENLHANELHPEQHPDVDAMIEALERGDLQ